MTPRPSGPTHPTPSHPPAPKPPKPKPPTPSSSLADDEIFLAVALLRVDLARGFRLPLRKAMPSFDGSRS